MRCIVTGPNMEIHQIETRNGKVCTPNASSSKQVIDMLTKLFPSKATTLGS